jgi:hypothetical protein
MPYAASTTVTIEASRGEIERTLKRYGADAFGYVEDARVVRIAFRMKNRQFRFTLTMPDPKEERFTHVMKGAVGLQPRSMASRVNVYDQACRTMWRALLLVIKAKLEAVEVGIVTLEDEFLAQTMTASGETVSELIQPQLIEHYKDPKRPLMLGGPSPSR